MTTLTVDPATHQIPELAARLFTAAEFALIKPPDCPVCGAPVTIQRIDVTWNAEEEALHGRTYIAGMWECPNYCNPVTGQRWHDWTIVSGRDGARFRCLCGTDEEVTADRANEMMALHQNVH